MKQVSGGYLVEFRCETGSSAEDMLAWLETNRHRMTHCESALMKEPQSLAELRKQIADYNGEKPFIFEIVFADEETALLAEIKFK